MKKSNNAPAKSMTGKMIYESREQLHAKIQKEINSAKIEHQVKNPMSSEERRELKEAKRLWKKSVANT